MKFDWMTGEPMCSPSERDYPAAAKENSMADKNIKKPTNWSFSYECQKMEDAALESLILEAQRELNDRKFVQARKIIDRVCTDLNELRMMGNVDFIVHDCDGYDFYVFGSDEFFDQDNFKIKGAYTDANRH